MNTRTEVREPVEDNNIQGDPIDPAILEEALDGGWKPLEEYSGPKEKWVDAETFVKRGREITPILRKHNEGLRKELSQVKGLLAETQQSVKSLQEYNSQIEERAYKRALNELKSQKKQAIAQQDHEAVAEIEEQIEELKESKPQPKAPESKQQPPGPDPVFVEWAQENRSWFNEQNPELMDAAEVVGRSIHRSKPQLAGRDFLDAVAKEVKRRYPEHFGNRDRPALVDGGSPPDKGSGSSSLNSLPNDARQELARLRKEKWYVDLAKSQNLTPDQMFVRDYGA